MKATQRPQRVAVLFAAATAASAVLSAGAGSAAAATLAEWNFNDFANTASYTATPGPWTAAVTSPEATVSTLSDTSLDFLEANDTRDNSAGGIGSPGLLLGMSSTGIATVDPNTPGTPVSTVDYLAFAVTANQDNLNLTSFSFDLGTSAGSGQNGGGSISQNATYAQLFYSIDGGTTFNAIGAEHHNTVDISDGLADFSGMQTYTVDLNAIPDLGNGDSVQFRLGVTDNRGGSSTLMGSYWDDFVVEGSVVPEPSAVALAGIAGLGLLGRRRRA